MGEGNGMGKEKIAWIDHVKLFASIMIMTAHFQDMALDACTAPPAQSIVYTVLNGFLVPFQTGKFWVLVFCILSGYLGCKEIRSLRQLGVESLLRWLRFFLPLLLCNGYAYLLLKTGCMNHIVYGERFANAWLLGHYTRDLGLSDVFLQSAVLGDAFNGPLWMLRPLFVGNLFLLAVSWLSGKLPREKRPVLEFWAFALLLAGGLRSTTLLYAAATYSGLLISRTQRKLVDTKWIPVCLVGVFGILYLPLLEERTALDVSWSYSPWTYLILGLLFVSVFFYSGYRGRSTGKLPLSGISFWVYLLHFPTAMSLGLGILLRGLDRFFPSFLLAMAAVTGSVLAVSWLLARTFDVWTGRLTKELRKRLLPMP